MKIEIIVMPPQFGSVTSRRLLERHFSSAVHINIGDMFVGNKLFSCVEEL
jgi:hypothetical protein